MKYSEIKELKEYCEGLDSEPSWRDVLDNILSHEEDFNVEGVRFIRDQSIDAIHREELKSDLYVLGCACDWFLSDVLDMDVDVIQAFQKSGAFEAIGKMIVSMDKLERYQELYANCDGYGFHFNHYDFSEDELFVNGMLYYVFDCRG